MKAYIFPGQGEQFTGMGLALYEHFPLAQEYFEKANKILGFSITDIMFEGTSDEVKKNEKVIESYLGRGSKIKDKK